MEQNYGEECKAQQPLANRPMGCVKLSPTITDRLEDRKAQLEADLLAVNEALELLKKNSDLQALHNALSKVRI